MRRFYFLPILVFSLLAVSSAEAQDFFMKTAGARAEAMGDTYMPSSSDTAGALMSNPAGLTFLRGRNLNLDIDTIFARGSFSNSVNSNAPLSNVGVMPYGAFGAPIGHSRWSYGFGILPEFASVADWKYVDAPGAAGATYGLQQQKSAILAFQGVGGVGYTISRRLSVGATFAAVENRNTLQAPYIFHSQPTLAGAKTLLDLHTNGVGWNTSVGVIATPSDKFMFGASWKSRTIVHSTGTASGDVGAQFAALGVNAPSTFTYDAGVKCIFPQAVIGDVSWRVDPRWTLAFQMDWTNWSDSFMQLPVTLTNGTNTTINGLVGSTTLLDTVPLQWKDQYGFHVGAERKMTESTALRFGYAHANDPVPASTLTPLTAAIMTNQVSTGFAYQPGRSKWEVSYAFRPTQTDSVGTSGLLLGEYSNSTVKVGTQSLIVSYSFKF